MFRFLFISIICAFISISSALANENCFIVKEGYKVLKQEGDCATRYSPASTFKIPLALMGYDSGILEDETNPVFPQKTEYEIFIDAWKGDHNPSTWMRDSCVWYSRVLTGKLGIKKFKNYVRAFDYGNMDISGDKGKNNGLSSSWLSSSLEISPQEQISFLEKVTKQELPVSKKSYDITKNILYVQALERGWKLYGKTGNGYQLDNNRHRTDLQHGWFVGWIEKDGRMIQFVNHIVDNKKEDDFASRRAKNQSLIKLGCLIDELEK